MDFPKRRNSNSNSNNSDTSSNNSNSKQTFLLHPRYPTKAVKLISMPTNVFCYSSSSSGSSSSSASASASASSKMCFRKSVVKRKRKYSNSSEHNDAEHDFDMPSAKRQQRLSSLCQSGVGGEFVQAVTASPNSPYCSSLPDSPHSLDNEDDSSSITSPSICSTVSVGTQDASPSPQTILLPPQPAAIKAHSVPTYEGERTPGAQQYQSTVLADEQRKVRSFDEYVSDIYCMTPAAEQETGRQCPLPAMSWANAYDVWQLMCKKDEEAAAQRDAAMLEQHPGLQPRMRAILLDWLIEVCEVYKLHRETYFLALDYLDRYLSVKKKVQKTHLQLIGITCLFVAAKVEEIYPPKIGEFAYVTDGACQESDILQYEILLLQALGWNISPVTAMGWLGVYMQLNVNNRTPATLNGGSAKKYAASADIDDAFIFPQFSGMEFVQTAQLLDLCSLDVSIANYPYSVLAAAAISHTFNRETALRCSGLDWQTIQPCARWMEPYFLVICTESEYLQLTEQNEQVSTKCGLGHICPNIVTDDSHIIQTHTTTMAMFDRACLLREQYLTAAAAKIKEAASPATGLACPEGLLTPPASSRKLLDAVDEEVDDDHVIDSTTADIELTDNREYGALQQSNIASIEQT